MNNHITLDHLESAIEILVRYNAKAKRISIKSGHNELELVLPSPRHFKKDCEFITQKESWVMKLNPESADNTSIWCSQCSLY